MSANAKRKQAQQKRSNVAAKKSAAKKSAAKKSAAVKRERKAVDYAKLFKQAQADGASSFIVSDAPNPSRHGVGSHDRTDGSAEQSAKARLFAYVVDNAGKRGFVVDPKALAKKFGKQESTIRSWISNWKRGIANGAFYPSIATEIGVAKCEAALAKLSK
jgi:hypothetical protein